MSFLQKLNSSAQKIKRILAYAWRDSAYAGASITSNKLKTFIPSQNSDDVNLAIERDLLVARCNDMYRNSPLGGAIVDRLTNAAIGGGLKLQVKIDRQKVSGIDDFSEFERKIETDFETWTEQCDFFGMSSFYELQELAMLSMLNSGDFLWNTIVNNNGDLLVQLIDSMQVSNPFYAPNSDRMRMGVEVDVFGRSLAYYVQEKHPGDFLPNMKWARVPIFGEESGIKRSSLVFRRTGIGQHRGIPLLHRVLENLRALEKYTDAELTAAVVSSYFTTFVKSVTEGYKFPNANTQSSNTKDIEMKPGMIVHLDPNEDISFANPNRPNTSYQPYILSNFQQIAAGTNLAYEFVLMSFNSSYSAARSAILQSWKTIEIVRKIMIRQFCNPIFDVWAATRYDENILRRIRKKWVGVPKGSIDETKEVDAATMRIDAGLSTLQIECEELGYDWLDILEQRKIEVAKLKEYGLYQTPDKQALLAPSQENKVKGKEDGTDTQD